MKKILIGAAVLAAITAASCSHKEAATAGDADTFAVSAATSDSVNTLFGTNFGSSLLAQYAGLDSAMKAEQPKADIIKGIQYALGAPEEKGVAVGMQIGLQILGNIQRMEEMGVKADRSAVLAAFKKAFLADSIDGATTGAAQMEYQALMSRIQQESKAFEDAKKANSPEALANVAEAEKYLKEAKAADPAIQTSESGLSYKIENAGDTAKITRRDVAQIRNPAPLSTAPCPTAATTHVFRPQALCPASEKVSRCSARAARPPSTSPATSPTALTAHPAPASAPTPCSSSTSKCSTSTPAASNPRPRPIHRAAAPPGPRLCGIWHKHRYRF